MNGLYDFPEALRGQAEALLAPGETVVWAGRPDPSRTALAALPIYLFAIPWTAISLVFFVSAVAGSTGLAEIGGVKGWAGLAFVLFSTPFVLIGLALMTAPLWAWREAARGGFLVTDRRVVKMTLGAGVATTKSLAGSALRGAESKRRADGIGSVKALGPIGRDSDGDRKTDDIVMVGVRDAAGAENAIWRLVEAAKGRG